MPRGFTCLSHEHLHDDMTRPIAPLDPTHGRPSSRAVLPRYQQDPFVCVERCPHSQENTGLEATPSQLDSVFLP